MDKGTNNELQNIYIKLTIVTIRKLTNSTTNIHIKWSKLTIFRIMQAVRLFLKIVMCPEFYIYVLVLLFIDNCQDYVLNSNAVRPFIHFTKNGGLRS
jgi:hypothetical protein